MVLAWTLTAVSMYTVIQLMGFLKSIALRPIAIKENKVFLRYGILSEAIVDIQNIESVEITSKTIEFDKLTRRLSPFGKMEGHNVVLRLKTESIVSGLYGLNSNFKALALHIDNKDEFKRQVDQSIIKNEMQAATINTMR